MDLQLIVDAYSCATYVADYVNKSNRGMSNLRRALVELQANTLEHGVDRLLAELGVRILNGVEMSSPKAAWFQLLRLGMSDASRQVVLLPTMPPE